MPTGKRVSILSPWSARQDAAGAAAWPESGGAGGMPKRAADEQTGAPAGTVDPMEIARFAALAESWWDPNGQFRSLHRINPVRLGFLRTQFCAHFRRPTDALAPFSGLRLLDIGCGGGLVAEPMARLGFAVTAIDAAAAGIAAARLHADAAGLAIDYRTFAIEDLAAGGDRFDAVLALEIVEHVADRAAFVAACSGLLAPGGILVLSTLNRTAKAWMLAVLGAEYVLSWLPPGTHKWRKFVRPSELAAQLRRNGLRPTALSGMSYDPLRDRWILGRNAEVNYLMVAVKTA